MFLVVGLGNPGRDYKWTRHNTGFEVIDKLAYDHNIVMSKKKFKAVLGEGSISGKKVMLVKPQTYMNLSGESVRDILGFYKLAPKSLLVVYDEADIPLGEIRIRPKGSGGGHNGMNNIIYQLGLDEFIRIRVGIGHKPEGFELADYVLSKFRKEEDSDIINGITKAAEAVEMILSGGLSSAMNNFNSRVRTE